MAQTLVHRARLFELRAQGEARRSRSASSVSVSRTSSARSWCRPKKWSRCVKGSKRRSERKFFPGYVLVQMEMDDETWHLVKEVPKVLGFIGGSSDKPAPITEKEADRSCSVCRKASTSRGRRFCSSRARWFASSMVRSTTSTASSKRSTTRRSGCRLRCRFWVGRRRSSWSSVR